MYFKLITFPAFVYPASRMYCGSWVDFPQPVSPTTTTTCDQQYTNYLSKQHKQQPVINNTITNSLNNKNNNL